MSLGWLMGPVKIYSSENINCTGLEESVHCPKASVPTAFASKYAIFLSYRSKMNGDSWQVVLASCDYPVGISSLEMLLS